MEACKEDSMELGPEYLPPGSDPQDSPTGMTEEPVLLKGIEAIPDTPIPSTV